jgi:hypothetical protein
MKPETQVFSYTDDDIRRMLAGMDRGLTYNYRGTEAQPEEPTLSKEYLRNLLKSWQLPIGDIKTMLAGINRGLQYNYNGQPASPGEPLITMDWLNKLQQMKQPNGNAYHT